MSYIMGGSSEPAPPRIENPKPQVSLLFNLTYLIESAIFPPPCLPSSATSSPCWSSYRPLLPASPPLTSPRWPQGDVRVRSKIVVPVHSIISNMTSSSQRKPCIDLYLPRVQRILWTLYLPIHLLHLSISL
ncbi:hypothetical protein Pcinc_023673 [Petrolisthes cinctipes]|uniref:Uncharacterized protein n=1 Tax=Petrolisthes cinctipes TaxID=88211 RepID=A0AAE1KGG4_PETCI|nr:hypothetical protein Pcinc_023673 [Petrolisthes cinctipes]